MTQLVPRIPQPGHGYPELCYSGRHQLKALAEAGYHVVAPDQRGYRQTYRLEALEDYNILASNIILFATSLIVCESFIREL
jgi:pimeloyl-ACP methyl ester carboxylesterase